MVAAITRGDATVPPALPSDADAGNDDDGAPGWAAIDRALDAVYHGAEPAAHFGTVVPYGAGGNDPLHGISVYMRDDPPHFHIVTYGFTDLFGKETDDPEESGFGFELTFRPARAADETTPPVWALNFLQNLARYVFSSGNRFAAGHKMGLNGPIAQGDATAITAICFADDAELGDITGSPHGAARFVQIVGITDDEYRLIGEWSTTRLVDMLRARSPLLVTDLRRPSLLADAAEAAEIRRLVDAEGSSEDLAFAGDMAIATASGIHVTLGALYATTLPRAMRGRLRHGRPYELRGRSANLALRPGDACEVVEDDGDGAVELAFAPALVDEVERTLRDVLVGRYRFAAWPALTIEITPSFIRDQDGQAIDIKGIADAAKVAELIAAENARLAAEEEEEEDDDDEDDDDDDDDDDEDDGDDEDDDAASVDDGDDERDAEPPPPPERILHALAMTERALRLAPADDETQFTHGAILLDADRAGMAGKLDTLLALLPTFEVGTRLGLAVRLARRHHPRFAEAVDLVLGEPLPARILEERASGAMHSFGDISDELISELAAAVIGQAPGWLPRLVTQLPDKLELVVDIAERAQKHGHASAATTLYNRALARPIPDDDDRATYLRAVNNACIHAHAIGDYATAVAIADRIQPHAAENPYIFHAAACAYAAIGADDKALEQVALAVAHDYEHLDKLEVDTDLGELLERPEFHALFRDRGGEAN